MEVDPLTDKEQSAMRSSADNMGADELVISDQMELVYQFIFDPRSKFSEITKLWSLTNINDADFARLNSIAKIVRILDKKSFYHLSTVEEWTGNYHIDPKTKDFLLDNDGKVIPEMVTQHSFGSRFTNLIDRFKGEIDAICAGAGGRQGALIRGFRTSINKQEQQVEDRTATKRGLWGGGRR